MKAETVFSVAGKVAFVTGGAAGLGQAMVQVLLANGAHVALFDRDAAALSDMVRRSGPGIMAHLGDVTDAAAVDAAVLATVGRFGALDICIANAGISDPTPGLLHECTTADWAKVVDVNLNGLFYTCRAALTQMQRQRRGKIITVASMWGLAAPAGVFLRPAYAASKGAVVNLTREMALHYADKGIQVNALCPGIFQTDTRPRDPAAAIAYTPMGRLGQMTDIAGATLFLASGASDFMTGQTLVIDGGVLAR
jgi:NAD(P)-dependent dehydrogenase (short-subunit alcohol dehydrogenase family)